MAGFRLKILQFSWEEETIWTIYSIWLDHREFVFIEFLVSASKLGKVAYELLLPIGDQRQSKHYCFSLNFYKVLAESLCCIILVFERIRFSSTV